MMMVCIAVDLARKFGLTAEQFGENLRDQYQRHDVEQDPAEPLDIAEQYIARYVCLYDCLYCWVCLPVCVRVLLGMSACIAGQSAPM